MTKVTSNLPLGQKFLGVKRRAVTTEDPISRWGNPEIPGRQGNDSGVQRVVTAALLAQLKRLPAEIQTSAMAALAMALAGNIDEGNRVAESARELRQCLDKLGLGDLTTVEQPDSEADEVRRRREERRRNAG